MIEPTTYSTQPLSFHALLSVSATKHRPFGLAFAPRPAWVSAGTHNTQLIERFTRRKSGYTDYPSRHARGAPVRAISTRRPYTSVANSDDTSLLARLHSTTQWEGKQSDGLRSPLICSTALRPHRLSRLVHGHAVAIIIHACFDDLLGVRDAMGGGGHLGKRALGEDGLELRRVSHRYARLRGTRKQ